MSLTTSISLYNLHPFYRYSVTVTAVTVGPGPTTIAFTVQTKEDGGFLLNFDPFKETIFSFHSSIVYGVIFFVEHTAWIRLRPILFAWEDRKC